MREFPWAAVAYPVAGAAAGAFVGFAVASPQRAFELGGPVLLGAVVLGGVGAAAYAGLRLARRRKPRTAALVPSAPASAPSVAVELPALEPGFPDVWGAGDALEVLVRAPAGAGVALATEPALAAEPAGTNRFRVTAPEGEVVLVARVRLADGATAEARRTVTFVRYAREIQGMVDDFRAWAEANVPGAKQALTARELVETVAPRAGAEGAKALLALARAYEVVTYGERPADRALFAEVVRAFGTLERVGLFDAPRAEAAGVQ